MGYNDIFYFLSGWTQSLERQTTQPHQRHGGVPNHQGKTEDHNNFKTKFNRPPLTVIQ